MSSLKSENEEISHKEIPNLIGQRDAGDLEVSEIIQQETLEIVRNPSEYYSHYALNFIIDAAVSANEQTRFIPLEDERSFSRDLPVHLWSFQQSDQNSAVIAMRPVSEDGSTREHFTGLHIRRNEGGNEAGYFNATYIDPAGSGNVTHIPSNMIDALQEVLGIQADEITSTTNRIQHGRLHGEEILELTNVHCGPFTGFILSGLAQGDIRIDNGRLQIMTESGWKDIPDLNEEMSNSLGVDIRERDCDFLSGEEFYFPEVVIETVAEPELALKDDLDEITKGMDGLARNVAQAGDDNLESPIKPELRSTAFTTPQNYRSSIDQYNVKNSYSKTQSARKESIVYRRGISKKEVVLAEDRDILMGSNRTTASHYPVIVQKSFNEFHFGKSLRKSGHDEIFQVANIEKWKALDTEFRLMANEEFPTFEESFDLGRIKSSELLSLYSIDTDPLTIVGHKAAIYRDNITTDSRKSVDRGYFKASGPGHSKGWDADKNNIIDRVVVEARAGNQDLKKKSPVKATLEVLKMAIERIVKYEDDSERNKRLFQSTHTSKSNVTPPFTNSGLNLSRDVQREYALKSTQASRDKLKMSVVALEGRWNDEDSDGEDYEYKDIRSLIKRKVTRTKINPTVHGGKERSFSPIRIGTPYSDFNFDLNFEHLEKAGKEKEGKKFYEAVSDVFAQPTPGIHPSEQMESIINNESSDDKLSRMEDVKEKSRETSKKSKRVKEEADTQELFERMGDLSINTPNQTPIKNPIASKKKAIIDKVDDKSAVSGTVLNTARILFKIPPKVKKAQALKELNKWLGKDAKEPTDFELLSELINDSKIQLPLDKRQEVSRAVVREMRHLKGINNPELKEKSDQFCKVLTDNNLLDPNLVDNSWPPLFRAANYGYRGWFNSLNSKTDFTTFSFEFNGNSTFRSVMRHGWFKESKMVLEKTNLSPELAGSLIGESVFSKEQKEELLRNIPSQTSDALDSMPQQLRDSLPPSSVVRPNIKKLSKSDPQQSSKQ